MNEKLNKTTICSIVFLDIIDYSKKSVSEQIDIKNQFNQLINHSLKDVDQDERIILDTGDGAAIAHLGSPEDALFVSLSIRDEILKSNILSSMPLYVRFGINLGPVRLVSDINGRPNIIGDGINVAQRIMSFAKPNQIAVSRSYYDVTSRLTQEISQMFDYSGVKHDKHVREHEIYTVRLMKDVVTPEVPQVKAIDYIAPVKSWLNKISWKYVALSLPAIFTCVMVIKSAASPSQPVITAQNTVKSAQPTPKDLLQNNQQSTENKKVDANAVNKDSVANPIQLANYVVEKPSAVETKESQTAADKLPKDASLEQSLKAQPEDKKSEKKVAKKTDKKLKAKKPATELKQEWIAPQNNNLQPAVIVEKKLEPQVNTASAEQKTEKSGWKTFTDSVKQGQEHVCTQAEKMMNQCH